MIEQEKQWDFLKDLTAKVSDVGKGEGQESVASRKGRWVLSSIKVGITYCMQAVTHYDWKVHSMKCSTLLQYFI